MQRAIGIGIIALMGVVRSDDIPRKPGGVVGADEVEGAEVFGCHVEEVFVDLTLEHLVGRSARPDRLADPAEPVTVAVGRADEVVPH